MLPRLQSPQFQRMRLESNTTKFLATGMDGEDGTAEVGDVEGRGGGWGWEGECAVVGEVAGVEGEALGGG